MIDKKFIGRKSPPLEVEVEKGQLRFFAKVVGESNPVYTDEASARKAGYRSLPAPPTFILSLSLAQPDPFTRYTEMGINLENMLHGEQQFEYLAPICAGDRITLESTIVDIFEKKGGALDFVIEETRASNQHNELVAKSIQTIIVRNG